MYISSSLLLRLEIDGGQLAPLPDILFSPNTSDQNYETAILFTIVQIAYENTFRVDASLQSPETRRGY